MKDLKLRISICVCPLVLLAGCSKAPAGQSNSLKSPEKTVLPAGPAKLEGFESAEQKERVALRAQVKGLFAGKEYDKLDEIARECRKAGEFDAMGSPRFGEIYVALEVPKEAPEAAWKDQLGAVQNWVKAKPQSITARVALADLLVCYAWKARGSGTADTVNENGWKLFGSRLQEAVRVLREAGELPEKCPKYWTVLLKAELGLDFEQSKYDTSFQQAIRSNPTYAPYYRSKAVYLLPRWAGQPGDTERFLNDAADRLGGEEGDLLYSRVVWQLHDSRSFKNVLTELQLSWPRIQKGFDVMEKRFPDSVAARSERAYLAALKGDPTSARAQFDRLEGRMDLSVWRTAENFNRIKTWVYQ